MRMTAYDTWIRTYHDSGVNLAKMRAEHPEIEIKTFPPAVMAALKRANDELLAEKAKADPLAKEIIDSQHAYQKRARAWTLISDKAYLDSNAAE